MTKQSSSAAILLISLCIAAGCSSSTTGSSGNESAVSQDAASATASEAAAVATSLTQTQALTSSGAMAVPAVVNGCPTVDVKSSSNSQWTDELLTFAAPPCEFTGARGYDSLAITGTLELTRSQGDQYNFASSANALEWAFTSGSTTYSETRTGTRMITASSSAASAANDMTILLAGAAHNGTLVDQLTASFTPASGSSLAGGEPLPSGSLTFTGSTQWSGSDGSDGSFSVTTSTPLAYDASCKDTEPSVFDSGELHVHLTTDSGKAYAKIVWQDCGKPTISFVAD